MKRIGYIIVLMLLPCLVHAGGFLGTIENYRDQIKRRLNVKTSSTAFISDTVANQFIREAVVTMMPAIRADKTVWTITTTYKQNAYSLDSTVLGISSVEWSKNDSVKSFVPVPRAKFYEMEHRETAGQKNGYDRRPSYYDYIDDQIFVYPPPTVVGDTIKIVGWQKVVNIDTATDLSAIPQVYRPAILTYSIYLIARRGERRDAEMFYRDYTNVVHLLNLSLNARGLPGVEVAPSK